MVSIVRLGPSSKLKPEGKGVDQSRTPNSRSTTTHHKRFYQFQDTHAVESEILVLAKKSIAMKKTHPPNQQSYFWSKSKYKPNVEVPRLVFAVMMIWFSTKGSL